MTRHFKYVGKSKRFRLQDIVLVKGTLFSTDDPLLADVLAGYSADVEEVQEKKAPEPKADKRSTRSDADRT